jgi:hypothetical protein
MATTVTPPSVIKVQVGSQQGGAVTTINQARTAIKDSSDFFLGTPNNGDVLIYNTSNSNFTLASLSASSKVSKSGDTMTGSLTLSGAGSDIKFTGGASLIGNEANNLISITANANNDITGVAAYEYDGGVVQLYSNNRVEIITDTGAAGALWTFNRNGSLTFPNGTIQTTAFTGYATDNTARTTANSAYTQANSATIIAQAAYAQANSGAGSAFTQAAFNQANTANLVAISAYIQANTANLLAISAYAQANTTTLNAQAAFTQANTSNLVAISAYAQANIATLNAQAAYGQANTANLTAISAYAQANIATLNAQAAYGQANTANLTGISAYAQANSAITLGQSAYARANSEIIGTAAYVQANTANLLAISAYAQVNTTQIFAQAAFDKANTGGSGSSSGYFPNAIIFANTTGYLSNVSSFQFYSSNNTIRTTSLTLTSGAGGQITFADGTTQTTAASGTGVDQTARTTANTANTLAQGAFDKANSEIIGTAAFSKANVANTLAQTGFDKANTANTLAQSAFDKANTASANTILLTGNVSPNLYTTSIGATVNSISVGGAPVQNAQVWSTYTMVQVFDAILFPTIGPSYTIPTITLTASNTGTLEIGQTINQSLSVTGTKNDAGAFTQLRITRNGTVINANNNPTSTPVANIASQFGYNDPNNQNYSYANTYIDSNTIVSGTTTWQGLGNYSAGLAKLNNKGATDSNAFAVLLTTNPQSANAATFASSSSTVTGIYPYFWGVSSTQPTTASIASAIQAGTTNKVLAVGSGTLTITFNASSQYIWLAVQTGYAAKTTWYNTALNNGSIGAGQFILSPVSQAVTSPNAYWSGVTYNVYISGYATTTSGSIQFS